MDLQIETGFLGLQQDEYMLFLRLTIPKEDNQKMSKNAKSPMLAFLWRFKDISPSISEMTSSAGATAIFDLTEVDLEKAASIFFKNCSNTEAVQIKISAETLLSEYLYEFLQETGVGGVWVELNPWELNDSVDTYLSRIQRLAKTYSCYPVISSMELIVKILSDFKEIHTVVIKGSEASGFVSGESTLTLLAAYLELIKNMPAPATNFIIWGGVTLPEAAAAFLAIGCKGIVFESVHWLTDLISTSDEVRGKLRRIRPEHTELVGSNLGVGCRLFNKGNSVAVRSLKEYSNALCSPETNDNARRSFVARVMSDSAHALDSEFSRDEIIPLGIEAAFAASFERRFGNSTGKAIKSFLKEIEYHYKASSDKLRAFIDSPVCTTMGTKYAIIQGAMSWITDVSAFALKVAEAGALPTIAVGLRSMAELDDSLSGLKTILGDKPFSVNIVALRENPHLNDQLNWLIGLKPKFAVIAAGDPSYAKDLIKAGIEVFYIAPTENLIELAINTGIRFLICEGNEAGGHVGQHTTLTLAQIVLTMRRENPSLFEDCRIFLAGGICSRETAFMAAILGADGVQMGTPYLTTKEIVETGALAPTYQELIVASKPGDTVVTGERTGLRVRSLRTSAINAICDLERQFSIGNGDESSFRRKMEYISAGSLLIAARGVEKPGGEPLGKEECIGRGQFMSGASAGVINEIKELGQLHYEIAESPIFHGFPFSGKLSAFSETSELDPSPSPQLKGPRFSSNSHPNVRRVRDRIAVTGLSVVNSLGNSPEDLWQGVLSMKSGVTNVPANKWDHNLYYDPNPRAAEKTYCSVGAFQNIEISRKELGIPPQDFRTMTSSTRITMWLAKKALESSGILDSDVPRNRIAVIISQNSGEAAATLEDLIIRSAAGTIVDSITGVIGMSGDQKKAAEEAIKNGRLSIDDTTLLGRLNCTAGGFICNHYGIMGPSFAVSAACATALVALYNAIQLVRNGIIDAALIGGAEEPLTPMHFLEFSALGALAGLSGVRRTPSEASRPFDANRDGMVLGEGGGMIVIERESIARKRGARIIALLTGMGAGNNHLGIVESSRHSQEFAMESAFADSYTEPGSVDLIECHATSTIQGDVEEAKALQRFFGSGRTTVLSSFKSQIGHTLGASGINSLIRGIMALNAKVLPPTLNYRTPDPEIGLESSGLVVLSEPMDWKSRQGLPRRFQVNAFGFGGSNYVVQVEESSDETGVVLLSSVENRPAERVCFTETQLLALGIGVFSTASRGRNYRVATVLDPPIDTVMLTETISKAIESENALRSDQRTPSRQGIYWREATPAMPLAMVFPGQGTFYSGMGAQLYDSISEIRKELDRAAKEADFDLLRLMFLDSEHDLQKTRWQQPALFALEYSIARYLISMGVKPVALAGHSLGELTALCLAGVYSFEDGFKIVNKRAQCMDKACRSNVDPGIMMAVDAPLGFVQNRLQTVGNVYVTNINSPHQIVIGGATDAVQQFSEELKKEGYRSTRIRVSMAFHSPIMGCIRDELEAFIDDVVFHSPKIPVISNTTMKAFPDDLSEIKKIVMAHLESPVNWMQNVKTLRDDFDAKVFLEIGPRDVLCNLIYDILQHVDCIPTIFPGKETVSIKGSIADLVSRGQIPINFEIEHLNIHEPTKIKTKIDSSSKADLSAGISYDNSAGTGSLENQIREFIRESFGKFLKPGLLEAIRKSHDTRFSEDSLNEILNKMFPFLEASSLPRPELGCVANIASEVSNSAKSNIDAQRFPPQDKDFDITESVIRIIMDVTGYERREIASEMDLREDLSIRSSRLPVIMDKLETEFAIKAGMEDFLESRTIADISSRIQAILKRSHPSLGSKFPGDSLTTPADSPSDATIHNDPHRAPIKRMTSTFKPVERSNRSLLALEPDDKILLVMLESSEELAKEIKNYFLKQFGISADSVSFNELEKSIQGVGRTSLDSVLAVPQPLNVSSYEGLVFAISRPNHKESAQFDQLLPRLGTLFGIIQEFLSSSSRKFTSAIELDAGEQNPNEVFSQGIVGMFLTLSLEYPSIQFRSVKCHEKGDVAEALNCSLDMLIGAVELQVKGCAVLERQWEYRPEVIGISDVPPVKPGDVVVLSGGSRGITSRIARSLAPLGCKLVLIGASLLTPEIDYRYIISKENELEEAAAKVLKQTIPGLTQQEFSEKLALVVKSAEIVRQVEELRRLGIEASYFACDVTHRETTESVIKTIIRRYGRIDGIVHGAGILRDSLFKEMPLDDFLKVVSVKFSGAINLLNACGDNRLKFFVCLSSAAAVQGNPGQVNYSTANRVMSALTDFLQQGSKETMYKALMLPPIEGVGMADSDQIKAMMKFINAGYLDVPELEAIFARELLDSSRTDVWPLFMSSLPKLKTVMIDNSDPNPVEGYLSVGPALIAKNECPMIDSVLRLDLSRGRLEAVRLFSHTRDLWLGDHKPYKFLKYPLVSAIMAVEAFLESSRLLFPLAKVEAVQNARFLEVLECPPSADRTSEIVCRRVSSDGEMIVCEAELATYDLSPNLRKTDVKLTNYSAEVVLGTSGNVRITGFNHSFPNIRKEEFDSGPLKAGEISDLYEERSHMKGRYRLLEEVEGSAPGKIRGFFVYREEADFLDLADNNYQYSPYLLEALFQIASFYIITRDRSEPRNLIPQSIGMIVFGRKCVKREAIRLDGVIKSINEQGFTWDLMASSNTGEVLMGIEDLVLRWFSP
jgi:acyl transferase domain-containing protein/NAD(P)H-dependent flavin oxidoreductase YrpB (nitropropane dioxygenase family)/NAD(P)-dependent dehydrogenase (short-subunit alcohol dehydrogenase family)/acyl carrier protein